MWVAIAMVVMSFLKAADTSSEQDKLQRQANKIKQQQMGSAVDQLNMDAAVNRTRTAQALFNLDVSKDNALGQAQLQLASTGTMGASANDLIATIKTTAQRKEAGIWDASEQQAESIRSRITAVVDNTRNAQNFRSNVPDAMGEWMFNAGKTIMSQGIGQGAENAASTAAADTTSAAASNSGNAFAAYTESAQANNYSYQSYLGNTTGTNSQRLGF